MTKSIKCNIESRCVIDADDLSQSSVTLNEGVSQVWMTESVQCDNE